MALPIKGVLYEAFNQQHSQGLGGNGRRLPCADFELNYAECMEAYGVVKGTMLCEKFHEDLMECNAGRIAFLRTLIMRTERNKKLVKGEIPWSKRHGAPYAYDSFVDGTFFP